MAEGRERRLELVAKRNRKRNTKELNRALGFSELVLHRKFQPQHAKLESPSELRKLNWEALESCAKACTNCKLSKTRTEVVFGHGNPKAQLMFVGEAPGQQEDLQGRPFVGRSGQLLDKMLGAMGLSRSDIYIANVVKCRPPENRNPDAEEIEFCHGYLARQLELVQPAIVVALGTFAGQLMVASKSPIGELRARFHEHPTLKNKEGGPVLVMPTYHPAFCLRNPAMKKPVWEDLQLVMSKLGLTMALEGERSASI